jgi:hypothetical protein
MLAPTPAYELLLAGEGTEPSNRRCLVPSHCIGQRNLGLPPPPRAMGDLLRC